MNPRITANQQRTFLQLFAQVRPLVESDSSLPRRIKDLLGRNRAFGSRDRRLYRELLYTAIRFLPWIAPLLNPDPELAARLVAWLAPDLRDTAAYRAALCGDWPAVPATLAEKASVLTSLVSAGRARRPDKPSSSSSQNSSFESPLAPLQESVSDHRDDSPCLFEPQALLPAWFRDHCPAVFTSPHLDAINERAPLWVRLQVTDSDHVVAEFSGKGWAPTRMDEPADAICLPPNAEVAGTDAYRRGFVEIQDLGSQLVLLHAPVAPGQIWLDACAGAGGKTLQLARLLGDTGRVDATDIRPAMLEELRDRAARARLTNVRITNKFASGYDGVLVDAPCSGTGTWRRLPHRKWYTQPAMLAEFAALQRQILAAHASSVRPGGLLVYATCSLSRQENHDTVAAFLAAHPDFRPEPPVRDWGTMPDGLGHTLLPGTHNSDGFYVALLRRA
jgi:16S rRNA (cytosine967-C5)-methyltransferase